MEMDKVLRQSHNSVLKRYIIKIYNTRIIYARRPEWNIKQYIIKIYNTWIICKKTWMEYKTSKQNEEYSTTDQR
jgi:hypothetical protein